MTIVPPREEDAITAIRAQVLLTMVRKWRRRNRRQRGLKDKALSRVSADDRVIRPR